MTTKPKRAKPRKTIKPRRTICYSDGEYHSMAKPITDEELARVLSNSFLMCGGCSLALLASKRQWADRTNFISQPEWLAVARRARKLLKP